MNSSTIILGAAAAVAALVLAAIAAVTVLLVRTERLVKSAATRLADLPCPRCGVVIGAAGAAAAGAARDEELRRLRAHARANGLILRIDPLWRFPCPACRTAVKFDPGASKAGLTRA